MIQDMFLYWVFFEISSKKLRRDSYSSVGVQVIKSCVTSYMGFSINRFFFQHMNETNIRLSGRRCTTGTKNLCGKTADSTCNRKILATNTLGIMIEALFCHCLAIKHCIRPTHNGDHYSFDGKDINSLYNFILCSISNFVFWRRGHVPKLLR